MAAPAVPAIPFGLPVNPRANDSLLTQVNTFTGTALGAFRELQLIDRVLQAINMMAPNALIEDLAKQCNLAWRVMIIPRLSDVSTKMWDAVTGANAAVVDETRNMMGRVHDVADGLASWGYASTLVGMPVKNAADMCTLTADVSDLAVFGQDYLAAEEQLKATDANNAPLVQRFLETSRYSLLRVAKSVCSVVSGVLGLLVLAFGGPVLPAGALLGLSLASTVFAISGHFYKETSTYVPASFYENRTFTVNDQVVR